MIGKRAAVKVLHARYSANEDVTSRFVAEARAVNQIRHRNIIDILAFGALPDGRRYYVMELLEGVPLDAYLERAGPLPVAEALVLLHSIARALAAAHEAGIAHRDLKPENVFLELDDEGTVRRKILDFGTAKLLAPGALAVHKTHSGTPIGSPRYMSPEQCRGHEVDRRTDVYGFGCMAHRMLAGAPPFEARTALELMMMHVSVPVPAISSVNPAVPAELDRPVQKMLEKQPGDRPQTMLAAYESLAQAAERVGCALRGSPSIRPARAQVDDDRARGDGRYGARCFEATPPTAFRAASESCAPALSQVACDRRYYGGSVCWRLLAARDLCSQRSRGGESGGHSHRHVRCPREPQRDRQTRSRSGCDEQPKDTSDAAPAGFQTRNGWHCCDRQQ